MYIKVEVKPVQYARETKFIETNIEVIINGERARYHLIEPEDLYFKGMLDVMYGYALNEIKHKFERELKERKKNGEI